MVKLSEKHKAELSRIRVDLPEWSAMELGLMEDQKPSLIKYLLDNGTLETWLHDTQSRMEEMHANAMHQGYNTIEANEFCRRDLLEEYMPELF